MKVFYHEATSELVLNLAAATDDTRKIDVSDDTTLELGADDEVMSVTIKMGDRE